MACDDGNVTCIPIGPAGPEGPIGPEGPPGPEGPVGQLLNFYVDSAASILMGSPADTNWSGEGVWYQPTGFENLTYLNTSGVSKEFLVTINYSSGTSTGNTIETYGQSDVSAGIFTDTNLTSAIADVAAAVQISFLDNDLPGLALTPNVYNISQNNNLFYKLTLAAGEAIHIQFQCKGILEGFLQKAQLFIQEL